MDLKQLQAMGALVPNKIFTRTVQVRKPVPKPQEEWADADIPELTGEFEDVEITIHIRRGSSADSIEVIQAPKREQPFVAIHRSLLTPDGKPLFESVEQAMQLELWLAMPLFEAISEVGGLAPKASRRKTNSGARSRLGSAAEASPSGSKS